MSGIVREGTIRAIVALASWSRVGKFVSVGVTGGIVDTAVLVVLVEIVGVLEELAALAGIEVAILVMFALNEWWTFRDGAPRGRSASLRRLERSHAVRASGVLVQFGVFVLIYRVLFVSVPVLGMDGWLLVAKGGGILVGMLVNYVFESLFTWRIQH